MILGLGTDLVDIRRIEHSLLRFGERFEKRAFTPAERERGQKLADDIHAMASYYAKRFAAKEACAKALGTGINHGVYLRDIEVVSSASGAPGLRIKGGAYTQLSGMMPPGMKPHVLLSLADEYPYAQAQVIISAVPV
jgi:holo-[acyl-carrier protein] synthase